MKYYHATSKKNAMSIVDDGVIYTGAYPHVVFLAESEEDALKFVVLRYLHKDVYVFEIDGLDESKVVESFDHSQTFFQARAFMYPEDISYSKVTNVTMFPSVMIATGTSCNSD